ncbi:transport and Golgi organization protein 1 isoform X2 [Fopius arisanus]|uniref:Transport and Golgi organization protein 1 isoform X2 n=2 Tax=Fopius arisanus TaxID=64838 RepID=A0A9R1TB75_9HYME|nr:PREDICTED: transport and Golgi organization protein 1 isoform X2 [Fopius arisanus]
MMGLKILPEHLVLIVIVTLCEILPCTPEISNKRLCADPKCSVPISEAKTVSTYHSRDKDILSFPAHTDVIVFSKDTGSRKDLWGVTIHGKRGYIPKEFLLEKRVFKKLALLQEVPTERIPPENVSKDHKIVDKVPPGFVDSSINSGSPSGISPQVAPSFEVVDGTTIPFSNEEPKDESYATKIPHTPVTVDEQPILSVHPNVVSSEINIKEILASETGSLPLTDKKKEKNDEELPEKADDKDITMKEERVVSESEENSETPQSSDGEAGDGNVQDEEVDHELVATKSASAENKSTPEEGDEGPGDTNEKGSEEEQPKKYSFNVFQTVTSIFDSLSTTDATVASENSEKVSSEVESGKIEEKNSSETSTPEEVAETTPEAPSADGKHSPEAAPTLENTSEISPETVVDEKKSSEVVSTLESPPETPPKPADDVVNLSEAVSTPENTPIIISNPVVDGKNLSEVALNPGTSTEVIPTTEKTFVDENGISNTASTSFIAPEKIIPENNSAPEAIPENADVVNETSSTNALEFDYKSTVNNERISEPIEEAHIENNHGIEDDGQPGIYQNDELSGPSRSIDGKNALDFNGFLNRNLLNVENNRQQREAPIKLEDISPPPIPEPLPQDLPEEKSSEPLESILDFPAEEIPRTLETTEVPEPFVPSSSQGPEDTLHQPPTLEGSAPTIVDSVFLSGVCETDGTCSDPHSQEEPSPEFQSGEFFDSSMGSAIEFGRNYWEALSYAALTALTTLLFSLGYYYIENRRRDGQFIAKINRLEKELLVATKECSTLDETLKSTKNKLTSIEDESFGSNEMVLSLKIELDNAHKAKSELEDQVSALEKDLEGATEAGLELERMLREILATNSAENPLAKSVEDLQARLNAQQAANESLTSALHLKTQEGETSMRDLALTTQKCDQLEVEVVRITGELKEERELRNNVEEMLSGKVNGLEKQLADVNLERINLHKQLKSKTMELEDLREVVNQSNTQNIDLEKLADASHVKAEVIQLQEERDDLTMKLHELEGAHQLLEGHMKTIEEEVKSLRDECKRAEGGKREAETRLEVLSKFFEEKEAERLREEAVRLKQQGQASSTAERLQTMNEEMANDKKRIESLERVILDQEKDYKSQITSLEAKAHEQWVMARQNERRLEESKLESAQLRNRLTLIEKNLTDTESDVKLHRMEPNGDPSASPLFLGAEASSSPIMFSGTSGPPPPPPSYLYGPPLPYLPPPLPPPPGLPPYDISQRPPPLGGRLASPPPMPPLPPSSRYDGPGSLSPPPPLSPYDPRNFPGPFGNERIPPPLPPSWGDEPLPPARNTGFHPFHRDHQRTRDKGSLHSSGESLDKSHHSGKV